MNSCLRLHGCLPVELEPERSDGPTLEPPHRGAQRLQLGSLHIHLQEFNLIASSQPYDLVQTLRLHLPPTREEGRGGKRKQHKVGKGGVRRWGEGLNDKGGKILTQMEAGIDGGAMKAHAGVVCHPTRGSAFETTHFLMRLAAFFPLLRK